MISDYDDRVHCPDCNSADVGRYAGRPYCGPCERTIPVLSDLHNGNLGFTTPIYTATGVGL